MKFDPKKRYKCTCGRMVKLRVDKFGILRPYPHKYLDKIRNREGKIVLTGKLSRMWHIDRDEWYHAVKRILKDGTLKMGQAPKIYPTKEELQDTKKKWWYVVCMHGPGHQSSTKEWIRCAGVKLEDYMEEMFGDLSWPVTQIVVSCRRRYSKKERRWEIEDARSGILSRLKHLRRHRGISKAALAHVEKVLKTDFEAMDI